MSDGVRILLIVSGGVAAYKMLELVRRGREAGFSFKAILTASGSEFITPLSLGALIGEKVYTDLWSLTDDAGMAHITLSRESDVLLVAPASANILARMAHGFADDLATTCLLASDKPVMVAPAMNVMMWRHPATQANLRILEQRGVVRIGPGEGAMACNETGVGRMADPAEILDTLTRVMVAGRQLGGGVGNLSGRRVIVTSGPTHEPIDPVRYIANRSSGRQGHAIAAALARLGACVTLVSGPVQEPEPPAVRVVKVETASEMLAACIEALPADILVCAAAVADWRVKAAAGKVKKTRLGPPSFELIENPDILATLSAPTDRRPALVIGFSAETGDLLAQARAKLKRKGCDWIVANDVSAGSGIFGGADNKVWLIGRQEREEDWPRMSKDAVAERLADAIASHFVPA